MLSRVFQKRYQPFFAIVWRNKKAPPKRNATAGDGAIPTACWLGIACLLCAIVAFGAIQMGSAFDHPLVNKQHGQ